MKKFVILAFIAGIAVLIGYLVKYPVFDLPEINAPEIQSRSQEESFLSDFLGQTYAVSIDNSPEARPQAGLSRADIIIETLAEGGITRLLAFFGIKSADRIGPIRSARPYFVDWALGSQAVLVHSGGSVEGLEKIIQYQPELRNFNEFFNEFSFWRDGSRSGPHNIYTSSENLSDLLTGKNLFPAGPEWGFDFSTDLPGATASATQITIDFSFALFESSFVYDTESDTYQHFLAGEKHIDSLDGSQIAAKNVVVLETTSRVIDQKLLTIDLETLGSGKAVIFRGGKVQQARWVKRSEESPLQLLEADNSEIVLLPGLTWIAVIDQQGSVDWK